MVDKELERVREYLVGRYNSANTSFWDELQGMRMAGYHHGQADAYSEAISMIDQVIETAHRLG